MKIEVIQKSRIRPEDTHNAQQQAILPVIDSWSAYWRTLVAIYFFDAYDGANLFNELRTSLIKTLNKVPQLTSNLKPVAVVEEGRCQDIHRVKATWGSDTSGGDFITAKTNARMRSLMPPIIQKSSFAWDRSGNATGMLCPEPLAPSSGIRVQVTSFACGGFSIAIDMDHALADAYTVGLFMVHWSETHIQMYTQHGTWRRQITLPDIVFSPKTVENRIPDNDTKSALLQKAIGLPTRRPDFRFLPAGTKDLTLLKNGAANDTKQLQSAGTPYMFRISGIDYERITRGVQRASDIQITDQVAFVGVLWGALNRARSRCGRSPLDLHLALSFRWILGLPEGLIGSPLVAIMFDGSEDTGEAARGPIALATVITKTLERYTEDALLGIVCDASMRDSPTSASRGAEKRERMEFTSGVGSISSAPSFTSRDPVFMGPPALPVDNLFIMADCLPSSAAPKTKWYDNGADIFVNLPEDVFHALMEESMFSVFEVVEDF